MEISKGLKPLCAGIQKALNYFITHTRVTTGQALPVVILKNNALGFFMNTQFEAMKNINTRLSGKTIRK
jgi:hypothetical protein